MPTTIYSSNHGSVSHNGKEYAVKNGKVDVPDDAVAALVEAHGFTTEPAGKVEAKAETKAPAKEKTALEEMTKLQLIALNNEEKLGADLKMSMTKEEIFDVMKPLWEAKLSA